MNNVQNTLVSQSSKGDRACLILYNILSNDPVPDEENGEFDSVTDARTEITAVRTSLRELGYTVRTLGLRKITASVVKRIQEINPDCVFNLCESLYEESKYEMYVAGFLELLRIPYTGSPPFALGLALNKLKAKQVLQSAGIPVPLGVLVAPGETAKFETLTPPYIVKPVREDGSLGISKDSVVETKSAALERVDYVHKTYNQPALVEEFIDGREMTVTVLGNETPRVLAISELDFSKFPKKEPNIVSYQAKWDAASPLNYICPAETTPALKNRIEEVAVKAFKEIGCRDYARIDMRVSDNRWVYILEANTNPDIAPESGMEQAAKSAGLIYTDIIKEIIENTLRRTYDRKK